MSATLALRPYQTKALDALAADWEAGLHRQVDAHLQLLG